MKKALFTLLGVACIFTFSAGVANAGWLSDATITEAAWINGDVRIRAELGGQVLLKFADDANEKELLAVALSALTTGNKATVFHDTSTNRITSIILQNN